MSSSSQALDSRSSTKEDQITDKTAERDAKRKLEHVRSQIEQLIRAGMSSTPGITGTDLRQTIAAISDSTLESQGHHTYQEKARSLDARYTEQMVHEAARMTENFLSKIKEAASQKWISRTSADRWEQRIRREVPWYQKKDFLQNQFPGYLANWKALAADRTKVIAEAKRKNMLSAIPEMEQLKRSDFLDLSYQAQKSIIDAAAAALAAYEKEEPELLDEAKKQLLAASAAGALAPHKVSEWLRRIFESGTTESSIRKFLNGSGGSSLPGLIHRWSGVRQRFDGIESKRRGRLVPGFHFATTKQFLDWHYDARLAYVVDAENRLNAPNPARDSLFDIRRELDMRDWASAEYLIKKARTLQLTDEQKNDLNSMETFLRTHRLENDSQQILKSKDYDPQSDSEQAFNELAHLSPVAYGLYKAAAKKGYGAVSALNALMYNRCWCRENNVLNAGDEIVRHQEATKRMEEVVTQGHSRGHEANVVTGHGKAAIRDQNQGEWSSQLIYTDSSNESVEAVAAKCEAQQNNHSFKYWTTLIPRDLDYNTHRYIVYSLGWRIKAGLRDAKTPHKSKNPKD